MNCYRYISVLNECKLLQYKYKDKQRDDAKHCREKDYLTGEFMVASHAFCHDILRNCGRRTEQNEYRTELFRTESKQYRYDDRNYRGCNRLEQ